MLRRGRPDAPEPLCRLREAARAGIMIPATTALGDAPVAGLLAPRFPERLVRPGLSRVDFAESADKLGLQRRKEAVSSASIRAIIT